MLLLRLSCAFVLESVFFCSMMAAQGAGSSAVPSNYILGANDQITLSVNDLEEVSNKPFRIDMRGDLNLPLAGRVHAAGLTPDQLEGKIELVLKRDLVDPHVVVSVTEFRSQPVSVLGCVNSPGVHQLEGRKTLYEVLSEAGGLRVDAGYSVKITRNLQWGRIPLPDAHDDAGGQYSIASVSVKSIMNGENPAENILIRPEDTITVPKANLIYVIGSVRRPGGFAMGEDQTMSALQVLSLAEGMDITAAGSRARIMRVVPGDANREEIAINLNKLLRGKAADTQLKADDILFIPSSATKTALAKTAELSGTIGSMAIYAAH